MSDNAVSRTPSRIVLWDKGGNLIHDADTPEKVDAVMELLASGESEKP